MESRDTNPDASRQQRENALGQLARATVPSGTDANTNQTHVPLAARIAADGSARPNISRRRVWIISLVALVAIIGGVIGYVSLRRTAAHSQAFTRRFLDARLGYLNCLSDVELSPDATRVALLGYLGQCPSAPSSSQNPSTGLLDIYQIATGKLLAEAHLDALITSALGFQSTTPTPTASGVASSAQPVRYESIAWAADGKSLAISFIPHLIPRNTPGGTALGLLLVGSDGTHARVLSHYGPASEVPSYEWDTGAGAYVPPSSGYRSSPCSFYCVGPALNSAALSYSWAANGTLTPTNLLTTMTPPAVPALAPIGQPAGGASFTIWQPGVITGVPTADRAGTYTFSANFLVWSPDGRFVIARSGIQNWRLQPSGLTMPSPQALHAQGLDVRPILPVRDQALANVLASYSVSALPSINVAWSPNGKFLAVQSVSTQDLSGPPTPKQSAVRIYDCASGHLLKNLAPLTGTLSSDSTVFLRWSADGSRLLLFDVTFGGITVWGPSMLPKAAA